MARDLVAAFWAKVDKVSHPGGCWLYTGFRKWDGYGWLARTTNGKTRYMTAHRYAWILTHGTEPAKGLSIRHKCDNAPCCNPAHLEAGTHADNMRDAQMRRTHVFGERSSHAKMTLAKVRELRRMRAEGYTYDALARHFGVSNTTAQKAGRGQTWKIDEEPLPKAHRHIRPERKEAA